MRRMLALALVFGLLMAPVLASAQVTAPIPLPVNTILYSDASMTVGNSAVSTRIFSYTLPAAFIATSSSVPSNIGTEIYTGGARTTLPIAVAPKQVHLAMVGNLRTNPGISSPGTFDLAVSLGGSTASLALANATSLPGSCTNVPVYLDVWVNPIALDVSTPTSANSSVYLSAYLQLPNGGSPLCAAAATFATGASLNAGVLGTTNLASPALLNVEWKWASAAHTNSIQWYNRRLNIGG